MAEKQTTEKQSTFKELVLPVIVLVVICLVCSALLAVLNDITAPIIAENTQAETLAAYVSVLPEGTTTDSMTAIDGLTTDQRRGCCQDRERRCRRQGCGLRLLRQGRHGLRCL